MSFGIGLTNVILALCTILQYPRWQQPSLPLKLLHQTMAYLGHSLGGQKATKDQKAEVDKRDKNHKMAAPQKYEDPNSLTITIIIHQYHPNITNSVQYRKS